MKRKNVLFAKGLIAAMAICTLQPAAVMAAEADTVIEAEADPAAESTESTDTVISVSDADETADSAAEITEAETDSETAADASDETVQDEESDNSDAVADDSEDTEDDGDTVSDESDEEEAEETAEPVQVIESGSQKTVTAVTDLEASYLKVAVWSQTNAQDDITWTKMTQQEDGSWTTVINTAKLQHSGNCFAHVYTNNNVFIGAATFTVTDEEISQNIIEITGSGSTRTASASLADSSVSGVKVAVWSSTNAQDDIKWYTLKKKSDGTWSTTIKLSNLKHAGLCYAHFYTTDNQKIGGTTFTVSSDELPVNSVQVAKSGSDYVVTATTAESASSLKVAVWSKKNAQDDIVWTNMKQQSDGSWTSTVNLNKIMSPGTCYAHVYTSKNVFIGGTSFTVTQDELSASKVSITGSGTTRTAKADLGGTSVSGMKVAVWSSTGGQDDIKWYTMSKKSNGSYQSTIRMINLKHSGKCYAHFYTTDNTFVGAVTFTVEDSDIPENEIVVSGSGTTRNVTVTTGSHSNVNIAVWSATSGQDDIRWYSLTKSSSTTWKGTISLSNLQHSGSVYVHCYADNSTVFLGNTTFNVSSADFTASRNAAQLQAASILNSIGRDLRSAFLWSGSLTYHYMDASPSISSAWYAEFGYVNKKGNCYVMAATFYYMAKELGYDAHQVSGYVLQSGGNQAIHSWVEIDIDGTTYVFDPQVYQQKGSGGYYFTYGTTGTWRYNNWFRMN